MDRVERVFQRLRDEGKIKKGKHIAVDRRVPTFEVDGIFKKTVKYNEQMNELSEEDVEMGLLHEEGHLRNPIKKRHIIYMTLPWLPFVLIMFFVKNILFVALILFGALVMFLSLYSLHVWFIKIHQNYEYLADEYAFGNVSNPLERISSFDRIPKKKGNKELTLRDYISITLGYGYGHPSIEKRKNRIKAKFSKE